MNLAVNEITTNGLTHGRPPVTVRAWPAGDTLVVQVDDRGGIPLPSAGGYEVPDEEQDRTRGLWLARQLTHVRPPPPAVGQHPAHPEQDAEARRSHEVHPPQVHHDVLRAVRDGRGEAVAEILLRSRVDLARNRRHHKARLVRSRAGKRHVPRNHGG